MTNKPSNTKFYSQIIDLLQSARNKVVRTVNQTMVLTYFEIGRMLIEEEQDGRERADYGKYILKGLSKEFGKGFSVDNLENMRRFYLAYGKSETPSRISENAISETASTTLALVSQRRRFNSPAFVMLPNSPPYFKERTDSSISDSFPHSLIPL